MWLILAAIAAEPAALAQYRCARLRRDEEMLPSGEMDEAARFEPSECP